MKEIIEKLEGQLERVTDIQERIDILNKLALEYQMRDQLHMMTLAEEAIALATSGEFADAPYELGIAKSRFAMGIAKWDAGKVDEALLLFHQALDYIEPRSLHTELMDLVHWLGNCYCALDDYSTAIEYYLRQLELGQLHENADAISNAYQGLGHVYASLGQIDQAIDAQLRGIKNQSTNRKLQWTLHHNIAGNYITAGKHDEALEHACQALKIAQSRQSPIAEGLSRLAIASAYLMQGKAHKVAEHLEKNLAFLEESQAQNLKIDTFVVYGEYYLVLGQTERGIDYLKRALQLTESEDTDGYHTYEIDKKLADAYEQISELSLALHHFHRFCAGKEAQLKTQSQQQLKSIEIILQTKTAKREAELLQARNEELEQRVAERTRELQDALQRERQLIQEVEQALSQATDLNRLKSHIISTVSHEFRTPLTVINSSTDFVIKCYSRLSSEKINEIHQRISRSIFYLSQLLEDVSLVEQFNGGEVQPKLETLSLPQLYQKLDELITRESNHVEIKPTIDQETKGVQIRTDPKLLRQILRHLLSNAQKYSAQEEPIQVTLSREANKILLTVSDKGIGISSQDIPRIFELFYRGRNVAARKGLGVGLYIVQKSVETLDGSVTVNSNGEDSGSEFTVRIPAFI
ncbi:tetratricopeptide repeat protein [Chloroflexi bacterium TSY]|nr:tetratricopeptide repeat protein [Chloroflexi bacterium TSY]